MATPRINNVIAIAKWPPEHSARKDIPAPRSGSSACHLRSPVLSECQEFTINPAMPSSRGSEHSTATRVSGGGESRLMKGGSQYTDESCAVSDNSHASVSKLTRQS